MATENQRTWQEVFTKWPEKLPKRGVLLSTLNEVTPFKSFLIKGDTLLLERTNPDPMGGRYILMGFDSIHMLKLIDPLKEEIFSAAGFVGHFAKM
jgi:hypothetical protein